MTVAMNAWWSPTVSGPTFPEFQRVGLEMVTAQGGIFGWVADSGAVIDAPAKLGAGPPGPGPSDRP